MSRHLAGGQQGQQQFSIDEKREETQGRARMSSLPYSATDPICDIKTTTYIVLSQYTNSYKYLYPANGRDLLHNFKYCPWCPTTWFCLQAQWAIFLPAKLIQLPSHSTKTEITNQQTLPEAQAEMSVSPNKPGRQNRQNASQRWWKVRRVCYPGNSKTTAGRMKDYRKADFVKRLLGLPSMQY